MKEIKKEKGITLVALIITIIVLLILAVVTIKTIGDSGILTYASDVTENYKKEEAKEKVQLALNEYEIAKYTSGAMALEEFLNNKFEDKVEKNASDGTFIITLEGFYITINSEGKITLIEDIITGEKECTHPIDVGSGVVSVGDAEGHLCSECGEKVPHEWEVTDTTDGVLGYGGACIVCEYECQHSGEYQYFDQYCHQCPICGGYELHDADDQGNCSKCNYRS